MTIENKEIQYSVGIEDLYLCLMKGMKLLVHYQL